MHLLRLLLACCSRPGLVSDAAFDRQTCGSLKAQAGRPATMHRAQVLARQVLAAACAAPPDVVKAFCLRVHACVASLLEHHFEGDGTNRQTPCRAEHAARSVSVCCQQRCHCYVVAGGYKSRFGSIRWTPALIRFL